jgi:hypothetical protein
MNDKWQADLQALEMRQADLRRRLENLDRQVAGLRAEMTAARDAAKPPPFEETPVIPAAVRPPPLPTEPRRADPLPPFDHPAPADLPEEAGAGGGQLKEPPSAPVPPRPRVAAETNLELKVGQYWLVRIGILVLLTGLVLLGNLAYQSVIVKLGAPGKLALLYLAGAVLVGLGAWLERGLAKMRNYARVLMAGGAATIYYTTYAAHFVPSLRVIENPVVGGGALLALAGGLAWFAARRKAEGLAFTAVLLSYYTSAINSAANFTLFSNVLLTAVAVFLLARHRWFGVSWLSLLGSYASFAYWRLHAGGPVADDFWSSHGFLLAYWVIFTGAVFLKRGAAFLAGHREIFLTANNAAFFALFAPAFHEAFPQKFWLFALFYGVLLLGLAQAARLLRREDLAFDGAYLAQGLLVVAVGLVAKFAGYQLGILLAVESAALLYFSKLRHALLLRVASGLAAAGAIVLALSGLMNPKPGGWLAAAFIGVVLVGDAVLLKGLRADWPKINWHWGAAGYSWAGLLVLWAVLLERFPVERHLWVFPLVTVVAFFSLRWHRLPELTVGAGGFLFFSVLVTIASSLADSFDWFKALPVLVGALVVMHGWQRSHILSEAVHRFWEGLNALAACVVLWFWLSPDWQSHGVMVVLTLTGLAVLVYGALTRAAILAVFSQGFTLAGVAWGLRVLVWEDASWTVTLGTIALVAVQVECVRFLPASRRAELKEVQGAYRWVLLVLVLAWLFEYVPEPWKFLALTLSGAVIFLPAALRHRPEFLRHAAVLVAAGVLCYVVKLLKGEPGSGADFLALILLLGLQQAGRKWLAGTPWFPAGFQMILAAGTLAGLWFQASRWVWDGSGPVAVTVVWAVLAFAALGAGFLLRERIYRLMGLLILAVAVGHVFLVDVWKLGQLAGILGILGLALVLLALGFIYNRFAEQIKKWL